MKSILINGLLWVASCLSSHAQSASSTVVTSDIDRFWKAYDSIQLVTDSSRQWEIMQRTYVLAASPGLKAFMGARDYDAALYVHLIRSYPKFWKSIRNNTLSVKKHVPEMEASIRKLRTLYPALKEATLYFTIGGLNSGGTTWGNMVLIGTEIATGNAATDVSEFPDRWLAGVFSKQQEDNLVFLNIHEYVHTQQRGNAGTLLAKAIGEGACDFIAELATGKPLSSVYRVYGDQHEKELKEQFKRDMFSTALTRWMYNGSQASTVADLGYYMGYRICSSYYQKASDKQAAVRDIIELNHSDSEAVEKFLLRSGYYEEPIYKEQLIKDFALLQPRLVGMEPFAFGDTTVDASVTELILVFSHPMAPRVSISLGAGGKDAYPITDVVAFSEDRKRLTLNIRLKPGQDYNLIVTNRGFMSADGYPLDKNYPISFRTKN